MVDTDTDCKDGTEAFPAAITASDARNNMGDLLDRAIAGERITITRHGKKIAAIVGARDLATLDKVA
jgi:prevent-host-death family protein